MKYIFRLKMMFLTFLLGISAVFVSNGSMDLPGQNYVEAPLVQTDSTVFIVPVESKNIRPENFGGGASGGKTCDEARAEAKRKNSKFSHPNCD